MAVTITNYGRFLESLMEGRVNILADQLWCMLVTSGYTFSQDSHKYKSAIIGELTGSGYTPGGKVVTTSSLNYDSATNILSLPAGNMAWPSVTFTGGVGAVLYMKRTGYPENAMPLVSYISFGESVSRSAQAFYINWPVTGVVRLTVP